MAGFLDMIGPYLPSWADPRTPEQRAAATVDRQRMLAEQERQDAIDAARQAQEAQNPAAAGLRGAPVQQGQERMMLQPGDLTSTRDATLGELLQQMRPRTPSVVPSAPPRPQVPVTPQPATPAAPAHPIIDGSTPPSLRGMPAQPRKLTNDIYAVRG
jgi:hypothetical protein